MKNQVSIFENFKSLKIDMKKNGWIIEAFNFRYKNLDYIVMLIRSAGGPRTD